MSIPILDNLHEKIRQKPDAQILHITEDERRDFYLFLKEYHISVPPEYNAIKDKLTYLGRKLEAYVPEE